jgi:hypothetical protein
MHSFLDKQFPSNPAVKLKRIRSAPSPIYGEGWREGEEKALIFNAPSP